MHICMCRQDGAARPINSPSPAAHTLVTLRYEPGTGCAPHGAPLSVTSLAPVAQPGTRTSSDHGAPLALPARATVMSVVEAVDAGKPAVCTSRAPVAGQSSVDDSKRFTSTARGAPGAAAAFSSW